MSQKSYDGKPTLYLVPTPIGNLGDMTFRSVEILKNSEVIFAEDTRESKKLLDYYDINKKLIAYHKFNEDKEYKKIIEYLDNGFNISIITDQGTPCISDPGYVSVYKIIDLGYNVVCLPGATAFTPALVTSGINPNKFLFYGFLDSNKTKKKKELEYLKNIKFTIIFYESPYRIKETLNLLLNIFGNRKISISREISKKYEEIYRGNISDVINDLDELKGEFVLVVDGFKEEINDKLTDEEIINNIDKLVDNGLSKKDAIREVCDIYNLSKNEIYKKYMEASK